MNGAQALLRTLINGEIDTCFMNPGTSEMHFVSALDDVPEMRSVLCLFEGVATGAADGYARMAGKPAATLLHLGPGLGNGIANLHNARRAQTPLVNIVGEHATHHRQYDAPLHSDIESLARPVSGWYRSSESAREVAQDAADAILAARTPPGQVATLVLPANTAWEASPGPLPVTAPPPPQAPDPARIEEARRLLTNGKPTVILLGNQAMSVAGQTAASRIGLATGARVIGGRTISRVRRGAGLPVVDRLPYPVDRAVAMLAGTEQILLAASEKPVAFFAYPGKPSITAPADARFFTLAHDYEDVTAALQSLADALDAPRSIPNLAPAHRPDLPTGPLTLEALWAAVAGLMPEEAIVTDEAITAGWAALPMTAGAPPHDWLHLTGGSIGIGLPLATGAAVACPDRRVLAMQADGSAMYTLQALWTQAREGLKVTTVLLSNRAYAILQGELQNVGAARPTGKAAEMLHLANPEIGWCALAQSMGVPAARAESADDLVRHLRAGLESDGPMLIEAVI